MKSNSRYICVYGAASGNINQIYLDAAYDLGSKLAQRGWNGINGAGSTGIMGNNSDGFLDNGVKVIGIIPQFMVDNNWQYNRLSEIVVTPDMHTRKELMAERCECAIAMPGGCGTLEELLEIITWRQLKIFNKPLIILNIEGFFNPLLEMLNRCIDQHFMKASHSSLWFVANTVDEAVKHIDDYDESAIIEIESKI